MKFLQIASTIEQFGNPQEMSVQETIGSLKAKKGYEGQMRAVGVNYCSWRRSGQNEKEEMASSC